MGIVIAAGFAALGFFSAGGFSNPALVAPSFPNSVSAPAGYQVTYARDFTTQGIGDWQTQPGASATVSASSRFGLGVEVTGEDGPDNSCDACNGPLVYPSTAWLSKVAVWSEG
jgi:hypothetical protein